MSIYSNSDIQAFLELLRAGLWEKEARLSQYKDIDYSTIMRLAEEQSIFGLVTAGLEKVSDVKIQKEVLLQFVGSTLQIEKQNKAMNAFIADLIIKLRKKDIYAILVKGQGIAQCYEKPLWRSSGDVDLLLSKSNYERAKVLLIPLASEVETEYTHFKHQGMTVGGWVVELHGTLHSRLSKRIDCVIDEAQSDVFYGGNIRSWNNGRTPVFLPSPDNDVIFVFTHILHHFFIQGIGLRQICDWCRLLWTYRSEINVSLLEQRLRKAGLMSEWQAFATLAIDWLGMPAEAIPLYSSEKKCSRKANRIIAFVLECGNFGHNRQVSIGKIGAHWSKTKVFARHSMVFPLNSVTFYFHFMVDGLKLAVCK